MIEVNDLDWGKAVDGLLPAVIQDAQTLQVLMLGYMNEESLSQTLTTKCVAFYSRSKEALWVKGETSGHFLDLISIEVDCDRDTILIQATPHGPTCHTGQVTCFNDRKPSSILFLDQLSNLIKDRNVSRPEGSYVTSLFEAGDSRIAQKVGEEGVELALAHVKKDNDETLNEAADLIFHLMVLLENADIPFHAVCDSLIERHRSA